jgi:arginine decarboxylase
MDLDGGSVLETWTSRDAAELYGVPNWGHGHFGISADGEVTVCLRMPNGGGEGKNKPASLYKIAQGLRARGMALPVLLRFGDLLDAAIADINQSFFQSIEKHQYKGRYRGVYPIKVNQQQQVIEEVTRFGRKYNYGLEAGSKAELSIALAYMHDPDAYIICNGYKDAEFIDLALYGLKLGLQVIIVIERPGEVKQVLDRAARLDVKPRIGLRAKLSSRSEGMWYESGGDRSVFGLTTSQIVDAVDELRARGMIGCLELLHYHLGSQVPNIRSIQQALNEACRIYAALVREGAPMCCLDIGGGLAVDYDGSQTNFSSSRNYTMQEFSDDVIDIIMSVLDTEKITHPTLITESGRATVAYYSVLLFNVLDVNRLHHWSVDQRLPEKRSPALERLLEARDSVSKKSLQEAYHDAIFYRDEIRTLFTTGSIGLRERALGEQIFWDVVMRIRKETRGLKHVPEELQGLDDALTSIYYGNLSVFQSLPDLWALDQLFPIMPIHMLNQRPRQEGIFTDTTCDCDGKISRFIDLHDVRTSLPLHDFKPGDDYVIGVFICGAYQETLGDLHNLFGDTNVVSIELDEDGEVVFSKEVEGDSVEDVLTYVEYQPKNLIDRFRQLAEQAVRRQQIDFSVRNAAIEAYESGIRGYTYFEE